MNGWAQIWRGLVGLLTLFSALCGVIGAPQSHGVETRTEITQVGRSGNPSAARDGQQRLTAVSQGLTTEWIDLGSRPHPIDCLGIPLKKGSRHLSGHEAISAFTGAPVGVHRTPIDNYALPGFMRISQSAGMGLLLTTASVLRT